MYIGGQIKSNQIIYLLDGVMQYNTWAGQDSKALGALTAALITYTKVLEKKAIGVYM